MQTVAITNLKGGVGKTTTAVHLAAALGDQGRRVLLVDADGQGHCAVYLGVPRTGALGELLLRVRHDTEDPAREYAPVPEFVRPEVRPGVDLIACDPSITRAEGRLSSEAMRELRLSRRLSEVAREYDTCLIDVGPKTDLMSTMALLAADHALIVSLPSTPDESLRDVTARLTALREEAGQGPRVLGVVAAQVDPRERLTRDMQAKLADAGVGAPSIPRSVALARAVRQGHTIFETEPQSPAAAAYRELAAWLTAQLEVPA